MWWRTTLPTLEPNDQGRARAMPEQTTKNEHYPLTTEYADLFQELDRARAAQRQAREGKRDEGWAAVRRESYQLEQQSLNADPAAVGELRKRIEATGAEASRRAAERPWDGLLSVPGETAAAVAPEAAGTGEFWWIGTNWWWPGGIEVANQTDGLHFYGTRRYDADPLWAGSVGAVARFGLDPARRPASPSGRYASLPFFDLWGKVRGWALLKHCPWACDDKWSKCWLHTRQTVLQQVGGRPVVVGQNERHDQLIYLEGTGYDAEHSFWGLTVPPVNFGLADPRADIIVEAEVRFDLQLEGSSWLSFSPQQNPSQSVVLGTRQWSITVT